MTTEFIENQCPKNTPYVEYPFDTITFGCKKLVPQSFWDFARNNPEWTSKREWKGYKHHFSNRDNTITVFTDSKQPYMYKSLIIYQVGDTLATPEEIWNTLQLVYGELCSEVYVVTLDAKIDDMDHDFEWYKQRLFRGHYDKDSWVEGGSTLYIGDRPKKKQALKAYDKVAESKARDHKPHSQRWAQLEVCTRVEKTVYYRGKKYYWANLPMAMLEERYKKKKKSSRLSPFAYIKVGNIDKLDKRTRAYRNIVNNGLHHTLLEMKSNGQDRELANLKKVVLDGEYDLADVWYDILEKWAGNWLKRDP